MPIPMPCDLCQYQGHRLYVCPIEIHYPQALLHFGDANWRSSVEDARRSLAETPAVLGPLETTTCTHECKYVKATRYHNDCIHLGCPDGHCRVAFHRRWAGWWPLEAAAEATRQAVADDDNNDDDNDDEAEQAEEDSEHDQQAVHEAEDESAAEDGEREDEDKDEKDDSDEEEKGQDVEMRDDYPSRWTNTHYASASQYPERNVSKRSRSDGQAAAATMGGASLSTP
ncbi:hypothetical protein FN846DRAFT_903761 [Sphaerosporella brunnea]|uniref:Uncharacterized protein n=1 Tax=Sphaerosporella brunnea TaxID=1250544 RepID=A0A5J5F642_9PEZI|nr:hypothetical protein FN846DRAFT_903761 [Sphaerosporella brunnea]